MSNKQVDKIKDKYLEQLGRIEPIDYKGFILKPIQMKYIYQYDLYKASLMVDNDNPYGGLPYLTMLSELGRSKGNYGYIFALLQILALSLQLTDDEMRKIVPIEDKNGHIVLWLHDGKQITESIFKKMRIIIALQNATELPDEMENPQFKKDMILAQRLNSNNYEMDIDYLIDGFCQHMRISRSKLFKKYSIYEFTRTCAAIENNIMFNIFHNGAYNFKDKPVPVPHWSYRRKNDNPYDLQRVGDANIIGEANAGNMYENSLNRNKTIFDGNKKPRSDFDIRDKI